MTILDELASLSSARAKKAEREIPLEELKKKITLREPGRFKKALSSPGLSFICELKKASPSKGLIVDDFDYLKFARDYEKAGASAISCLTETDKFLGSLEYLKNTAETVELPVLRKDFLKNKYQIYEAAEAGAGAVLLIVAILDDSELEALLKLAHELNLDALVEVHNEEEVSRALSAGAEIIGINNRDLRDFSVDLKTTERLISKIPEDKIIVSESGIHSPEDIKYLKDLGVDAVLIGEQLMRSENIPRELERLKNES